MPPVPIDKVAYILLTITFSNITSEHSKSRNTVVETRTFQFQVITTDTREVVCTKTVEVVCSERSNIRK